MNTLGTTRSRSLARALDGRSWLPAGAAALDRLLRHSGFAFAALGFLAFAAFGAAIHIRPLDTDNAAALTIGHDSSLGDLLTGNFIASLPGYRPLPYWLIGLEGKLLGTAGVHYFVVNLLLTLGCGLALYAIVASIGGRRLAALAAAAAFLVDPRIFEPLIWIGERQSTLACGLGAAALFMAYRTPTADRRPVLWSVSIGALLLLSALSKEYGLAFAPAVVLVALLDRRGAWRTPVIAGVGALTLYAAMRLGLAGGANAPFCDAEALVHQIRVACFGKPLPGFPEGYRTALQLTGGDRIDQYLWNVFSTFCGTFFPFLFSSEGALRYSTVGDTIKNLPPGQTFFALSVTGFALVGLLRRPRTTFPLFSLIVLNALLSLMLYRTRNQLVGMFGLYAAAGVGLASVQSWADARLALRLAAAPALGALALWLGWQATLRSEAIETYKASVQQSNPCFQVPRGRLPKGAVYVDPTIVRELKLEYALPDPDCRHVQRPVAPAPAATNSAGPRRVAPPASRGTPARSHG